MKYTILLISLFVANFTYSSTSDVIQNDTTITNLNYDKLLAEKLGGYENILSCNSKNGN
jgi:hypothetical protein